MSTAPLLFNVLDYGAVGDGSTDPDAIIRETTAIQNCINAAQAVPSFYGGRGGKVYAPEGRGFLTNELAITKPIAAEFNSPLIYAKTTGAHVTVGAPGWQQYHDLEFAMLVPKFGNSGMPSSVNVNGNTGVRINGACYSRFRFDVIQGFTNCGIYVDGTGDVFAPQVIQHNHFDFGQIVNNGIGMTWKSLDAATSSAQANFVHTINCYQNYYGFVLDDQGGSGATDSNYFLFDSIDNANQAAGGQGGVVNGKWNRIDITYLGCNVWFGATSAHNTLNLFNTPATQATYTAGGTNNRYNTAP